MLQETSHGPRSPGPVPRQLPEPPAQAEPLEGLPTTPFKYLDYFEESEHDSFAGRDDEVQEVLVGLTRGKTYVVYGRSGLGKTSLMLAGVSPKLRQRGFLPMRLRLLDSPVADFCSTLATELDRPELAREMSDAERLELVPRVLAEHSAHEPLVLVLDQFEEFFVRFKERPEEQARFTALLGRLWHDPVVNARLVFSMREDYYAQLADLRPALPDLMDNGLRLMPLTAYGARQAIVRPLQQGGIGYEEAFVRRLVDLLAPWLFEPPALQIVCTELYRDVVAHRGFPVHLTCEDLERLGGVDGLFSGYVNRVTRGLAAERLLLVRVVLDTLIAPEARTRRAMRAEDLLAVPMRVELGELREVLGHLTALRLLRVEDRQGERWYELLHEPLVPIIEAWLLTDADYVRFRQARKFVASLTQGTQWREDPGWLLSAAQLSEGVEPWKELLRLDEQQVEFLLRSSIHARTGSIGYWAERFDEFGRGRSVELLLKLTGHSHRETRMAAVAACGQVKDVTGQLARRCLSLALSEREESMRRTAGSSFARLVGPRDLQELRRKFSQRRPSDSLLGVLADLCEAGHQLRSFPLRWRSRARALVNERAIERHQRGIRHLVNAGVRAALLATPLWCLSVGVLQFWYRAVTLAPKWVSQVGAWTFTVAMVATMLTLSLFLFIPSAVLVAWHVTRRAAVDTVLHGSREWSRSALGSVGLMLCSVLMSFVGVYVALQLWHRGEPTAAEVVAPHYSLMLLASAVLGWLMTTGLIWLGSRCIPRGTSALRVYLWALLSTSLPPIAAEEAVGGLVLSGWLGPYTQLWMTIIGVTGMLSSFLAMVLLCALNQSLDPLRSPALAPRHKSVVLARTFVLLSGVAFVVAFLKFVGLDTIPFHEQSPLQGELSWAGSVWNVRDADYTLIQSSHEGRFALSVNGGSSPGTQLVIHGDELTSGSLLISTLPTLIAAVIASPEQLGRGPHEARSDYHYVMREEPIHQTLPPTLSADHWTLVTLRLNTIVKSEGKPTLWQVWLEGEQPLQPDITGVQVRPVMLQIPEFPAHRCLAVMGSSALRGDPSFSGDIRTFIAPNRMDTAVVPPPNSRAQLLLEDFQVALPEEGRWSLLMTVIPFTEFTPPQCQEKANPLALLSPRESEPGADNQPATLTVAIKLY